MKLRLYAALWSGLAILAACDAHQGPLEEAGEDLDNVVEETTDAAQDVGDKVEDTASDIQNGVTDDDPQ